MAVVFERKSDVRLNALSGTPCYPFGSR